MSRPLGSLARRPAYIFLVVSIIFTLSSTIMLIIVFNSELYDAFGFEVLIGPLIFIIIGGIMLVVSIGMIYKNVHKDKSRKRKRAMVQINSQDAFFTPAREIMIEPIKEKASLEHSLKDISSITTKESIDWNKIYPLIYQEKIENKICPICKLEIEEKEFIIQCPNCMNLFHGKHLVEWLLENEQCPICQTSIEIE